MARPLLPVLLVLLSTSLAADEFYVPLGGTTDVQLVNASADRADVTIEVLGGKTERMTLEAGQKLRWAVDVAEAGAVRITGDATLQVTAQRRCSGCSATVPVLDVRYAGEEGELPARVRAGEWRSGVAIVNPGAAPVVLTLGHESVVVPGRGIHCLSHETADRLPFTASAPVLLLTYDANERSGARVFTPVVPHQTKRKRRAVRSGPVASPPPPPQTVVLTPSKDNTLFESFDGAISNGAGIHVFSGATAGGSLRRALLAFNVASQIPPGSRVTRATLTMRVSMTIAGNQPGALHRVTADWGEGVSNAGASRNGNGALARTNDATWIHTFFNDRRWTTAGGDFNTVADAITQVGSGVTTWESSAAMIARVQEWVDQPATNFGWILIGNETNATTAKRFDSREAPSEAARPSLTVEFQR